MSGDIKVSLIVPVYCVQAYLSRCVQSIVDQTYTNLEIILVDDGSPDECPQMCDDWAKRDDRIRVIHKENGGLSDARNAGIAVASGEYVGFVDGDDWLEPAFVHNLLNSIIENDCEVAGCNYRKCSVIAETDNVPAAHKVQVLDRLAAMSALIDNCILEQAVWNKLYKRELIEGILFEKGKYHEDEFWTYQVIAGIERIAVLDYIGYNYFQRADSIMGKRYSLKRLDAVEAKVRRQEYLEENMPELAAKGRVNLAFTCMWHGQMAIQDMSRIEKRHALSTLSRTYRKHSVQAKDMKQLKASHRVWIWAASISLPLTCWARNRLKVGI